MRTLSFLYKHPREPPRRFAYKHTSARQILAMRFHPKWGHSQTEMDACLHLGCLHLGWDLASYTSNADFVQKESAWHVLFTRRDTERPSFRGAGHSHCSDKTLKFLVKPYQIDPLPGPIARQLPNRHPAALSPLQRCSSVGVICRGHFHLLHLVGSWRSRVFCTHQPEPGAPSFYP